MGHFKNTKIALDKRLSELAGGLPIAWENINFVPTLGVTYLRQTLISAPSDKLNMEHNQRNSGIYQIDVFSQEHKGPAEVLDIMDDISDLFAAQRTLTAGGTSVHISAISRLPFAKVDGYLIGSVQVIYICYT